MKYDFDSMNNSFGRKENDGKIDTKGMYVEGITGEPDGKKTVSDNKTNSKSNNKKNFKEKTLDELITMLRQYTENEEFILDILEEDVQSDIGEQEAIKEYYRDIKLEVYKAIVKKLSEIKPRLDFSDKFI